MASTMEIRKKYSTGNLSEEQVHCSICLDVFTSPVSIPCGHNFCKGCILGYWKTSTLYQCPMCKKTYFKRPDISINTVLREIAEQFKEIRVTNAEKIHVEEMERKEQEEKEMMEEKRKKEEEVEKEMVEEKRKKEEEEKLVTERQKQLLQELKQKQEDEQKKKHPYPVAQMVVTPGDVRKGLQEDLPPLMPPPLPPTGPPSPTLAPVLAPCLSPILALVPAPAPALNPFSAETQAPSPPPAPSHSPWGEVFCDVCLGAERPKAVKSCLVCLTSYCQEHLTSHSARFTKHKLMEPVANLEDRMCQKHERLLELFCKKDQVCVCVLCTETDHRGHYTIPVERECTEKKAHFKGTKMEIQQMITDRLRKVEELKHCVELNKSSAQREIEDSMAVLSELVRSIQRTQADLVLAIEEKQRQTESRAQGLIAELEQEIAELNCRNTDLEHLGRTEDHIHFLQTFPSLSTPPHTKDWSGTSVHTEVCVGIIRRAVAKLEDTFREEMDKLIDTELKRTLKYTVDLTLDPDTANPWLQLSDDRRQVRHLGAWQDLPDNPERFDTVVIVFGQEGFSSGRHYWEVAVGDKDDWYLGVARASVNRKGRIAVSSAHGYWALAMKKGHGYRVSTSPPLQLTLDPKPSQVGVYVDCEEGQVSFYDVRARSHIYTFMDSFREKIYPFFYLYCCDKASDSMVICPIIEQIKQC